MSAKRKAGRHPKRSPGPRKKRQRLDSFAHLDPHISADLGGAPELASGRTESARDARDERREPEERPRICWRCQTEPAAEGRPSCPSCAAQIDLRAQELRKLDERRRAREAERRAKVEAVEAAG